MIGGRRERCEWEQLEGSRGCALSVLETATDDSAGREATGDRLLRTGLLGRCRYEEKKLRGRRQAWPERLSQAQLPALWPKIPKHTDRYRTPAARISSCLFSLRPRKEILEKKWRLVLLSTSSLDLPRALSETPSPLDLVRLEVHCVLSSVAG